MSDVSKPIPSHGSGNPVARFFRHLFGVRDCLRLRKLLYQYVEGELDAPTYEQLKKHLGDCPPCLEYVETYRKTVSLCRCHGSPARSMPPELQKKLQDFITDHPELR